MSMVDTAKQYLGVRGQSLAHKGLVDYYNTHCIQYVKPSRKYKMTYYDDWCAMFCSVMAHMNGVKGFPYEVSVYYMWQIAKEQGTATQTPRVNDLIIYDWGNNGTLDHVGIVANVSGNTLTIIEGNAGNEVIYRTIDRYNTDIEGFIRTNSGSNVSAKPQQSRPQQTNLNEKDIQRLIIRTMNGDFGNGDVRKQKLGKNYNVVQSRINKMNKIDFIAYDVINGKYGVGETRRKKLGKNYNAVQKRVNQILS